MAEPEPSTKREANKYYLSWLRSTEPTSAGTSSKSTECRHDPTLFALAQLLTLRLNVKNGTISLIRDDHRVLLAEAGQDSPLTFIHDTPKDFSFWNECHSQEKDLSLDSLVLGSIWQAEGSDAQATECSAFVANDAATDERLSKYASTFSHHRIGFYAGVPILTHTGQPIGVLAISDTHPKSPPLTVIQVKLLQDIACIVSNHLERVRRTMDQSENESFVRGLTSFVEGLTEYKDNLNSPGDAVMDTLKEDAPQPDDTRATDPEDDKARGRPQAKKFDSDASTTVPSLSRSQSQLRHPDNDEPRHVREINGSNHEDLDKSVDNVKYVFDRAAYAITQATDADGCVFFDASPSIFAVAPATQPDRAQNTDHPTYVSDTESSEGERPSASDSEQEPQTMNCKPSQLKRRTSSQSQNHKGQEAAIVLGSSIAPDGASAVRHPLSRKELKRCLRRYPFGKCFLLAEGQVVSSGHSVSDDTVTGGGTSGRNKMPRISRRGSKDLHASLPASLLKHLPDAKWLMILPLYNYAQHQWHACGFIWSTKTDFHNLETQIPHLKAFGSCIMSEVISMEAMNTSIARTTFIASISHDLRSPLHGVLGNLEFLEDTLTSAYQVSLVGSIETCGKTLLDTIDHLLDYAKINNLNRADKQSSRRSLPGMNNNSSGHLPGSNPSSSPPCDLALLFEEVTEAAFAGQTFRKKNLRGQDAIDEAADKIRSLNIDDCNNTEQSIHQGSAKFSGKVFFVLDIQCADSWIVNCDSPGAVRRIILNLIGNAIKYCESGCIEAKLSVSDVKDGPTKVTISIKDTGIGMSKNFLEKHLFKAFSQENSFSAGPGLGLSIAQQLVEQLKGSISVRSEKGVGTHVDVSVPMQFRLRKNPDPQDILQKAIRVTSGKKICLLNPDKDESTGTRGQVSKLTASIAGMCEDWFKMEFVQGAAIEDESDSSVYVYAEPPPIEYLLKHHSERRAAGKDGKEQALLIVCTNAFEAAALRSAGVAHLTSLGRVIEVISQPVGVRKLAKVLLSCLQRVGVASDNAKANSRTQSLVAVEANQGSSDTKWSSSPVVYDSMSKQLRPSIENVKWKSEQPQVRKNSQDVENTDLEFGQIKAGVLPEPVPMQPRVINEVSGETRMPRVLAVDDNPINLRLLINFMKKIKLPYVEAVNGLEALNKFKEAEPPFDYVLMDLQMPVMDGLESTRKIRDHEREMESQNPAVIIAITGVGSESVKQECMESGMTQFLTKPVKFKTLQQMLERHNTT